MALFMVSYDLRNEKDYSKIINELSKYDAQRILRSQWLVTAEMTKDELMKWLKGFIDADDQIVVLKFNKSDIATHRPLEGTSAWLANH